jgi:signal transduction histidine kinase
MDFAKPVPPKALDSDLPEIVDKALREAKAHGDGTDRIIELAIADVPPVVVDPNQLQAALVELFDNAYQATEAGKGRIEIGAKFDPYSQRVVLTIADNGCGMDEATLKRAFDPFFSSKPAGRRRGMGLPKALRWIESSGGSMRLESSHNQGTQATVLLPASKNVATQLATAVRKKA